MSFTEMEEFINLSNYFIKKNFSIEDCERLYNRELTQMGTTRLINYLETPHRRELESALRIFKPEEVENFLNVLSEKELIVVKLLVI